MDTKLTTFSIVNNQESIWMVTFFVWNLIFLRSARVKLGGKFHTIYDHPVILMNTQIYELQMQLTTRRCIIFLWDFFECFAILLWKFIAGGRGRGKSLDNCSTRILSKWTQNARDVARRGKILSEWKRASRFAFFFGRNWILFRFDFGFRKE